MFKDLSILVIGDVCLDEYVFGNVKRISPEAPVPILEVTKTEQRLGMAANVAANIRALGATAHLVSVIGADEAGQVLAQYSAHLVLDQNRQTTRKLRVLSEQHHLVRIDYEDRTPITGPIENALVRLVSQLTFDAIIVQDYGKGVVTDSLMKSLVATGLKVFVDPHITTPVARYQGAYTLSPNALEASVLGVQGSRYVITKGPDGMTLYEDGVVTDIPTEAELVFDVTGAGDTVIAVLALAVTSGLSMLEACRLANKAAGVVVGKIGCATCTLEELNS